MNYRIYIVEDDPGIAGGIASLAKNYAFETKSPDDFRDIMPDFAAFSPHIVLMDISLPFAGGFHWCTEIRKISNVPIIFISSASDNMNMVIAMNMGADDFVAKPFDGNVLMAKIQALLRRTYDFSVSSPILSHRGAFLNTGDGSLSFGNKKIELTKNEYRILLCLLEKKGQTVSRETLMERLWETDSFVDENTLSVNIGRLRKKLDAAGLNDFIVTKFGVGYLIPEG